MNLFKNITAVFFGMTVAVLVSACGESKHVSNSKNAQEINPGPLPPSNALYAYWVADCFPKPEFSDLPLVRLVESSDTQIAYELFGMLPHIEYIFPADAGRLEAMHLRSYSFKRTEKNGVHTLDLKSYDLSESYFVWDGTNFTTEWNGQSISGKHTCVVKNQWLTEAPKPSTEE